MRKKKRQKRPPSEYTTWQNVIRRCSEPKTVGWARYGGRGISICQKWRDSYQAFLEDVGPKPTPKHTLDRIDNDGNYEPGNVRWATRVEQANNNSKTTLVLYNGKHRPLTPLCRELGIDSSHILTRLRHGKDFLEALDRERHNHSPLKMFRGKEPHPKVHGKWLTAVKPGGAASAHEAVGKRFGRLIVKSVLGLNPKGTTVVSCDCDCGTTDTRATMNMLAHDAKTSCGCRSVESIAERSITHGHCRGRTNGGKPTTEYAIWSKMRDRCTNPNNPGWERYGGRGITMDPTWRASFETFLKDVGSRPGKDFSLDRLDNSKGYEPSNVAWRTLVEQANNKRTTAMITYEGVRQPVTPLCRKLGLKASLVRLRLSHGWSDSDALWGRVHSGKRGKWASRDDPQALTTPDEKTDVEPLSKP